jgi:hypothetical protein
MSQFLFIFRSDVSKVTNRSPEQMQASMQRWMDWIGGIAAQNKLIDRGNRLESTGKVVKSNQLVTDGPYAEVKESIGGYTIVQCDTLEEAAALAKGCPIFDVDGSVEVRQIGAM